MVCFDSNRKRTTNLICWIRDFVGFCYRLPGRKQPRRRSRWWSEIALQQGAAQGPANGVEPFRPDAV